MKTKATLLAILSFIGLAASFELSRHHYELTSGQAGFKSFCNLGQAMNCDSVATSSYAKLFGIPLSNFTAGWYLALIIIALLLRSTSWQKTARKAALGMTAFGTAMSLIYLYIMAQVIGTFCLFCLIIDGVNLISLGIVLTMKPSASPLSKSQAKNQTEPSSSDQWKTILGVVAGSLIICVLALKGAMQSRKLDSGTVSALIQNFMSAPVIAVGSGPEYPSIGPANAPITIVEFSDFQCPHCKLGAQTVHAVMARFPGKVRVVLRNFPLDRACNSSMQASGHPHACEAAKHALCSFQMGKFEPVYEGIFENQERLKPDMLMEISKNAGLDEQNLKACLQSPEIGAMIQRDLEEGARLGVAATPTIYVNGKKMEGVYPVEVWFEIVERLLAQGQSQGS